MLLAKPFRLADGPVTGGSFSNLAFYLKDKAIFPN